MLSRMFNIKMTMPLSMETSSSGTFMAMMISVAFVDKAVADMLPSYSSPLVPRKDVLPTSVFYHNWFALSALYFLLPLSSRYVACRGVHM